jgi:hypothetical protein
MTESEWLECADDRKLLDVLEPLGILSDRKVRLYLCALSRPPVDRIPDATWSRVLWNAEQFADGLASEEEVQEALTTINTWKECAVGDPDFEKAAWYRDREYGLFGKGPGPLEWVRMRGCHGNCALLREIMGNFFRPLRPRAFSPGVVGLALSCYEGDHALYPLLADALEEVGEEEAAAHCRGGGHVKGCFVVDWVLGRS